MRKISTIILLNAFTITVVAGTFASRLRPIIRNTMTQIGEHATTITHTVTQAAKRGAQSVVQSDKTVVDIVDKTRTSLVKPLIKVAEAQQKPTFVRLRTTGVDQVLTPAQQLKKKQAEETALSIDAEDSADGDIGLAAILETEKKSAIVRQAALSQQDAQASSTVNTDAETDIDTADIAPSMQDIDVE